MTDLAQPAALRPQDVAALADALRPALLRVSRRLRQEATGGGLSAQDSVLLGQIRKSPGIGVSALAEAENTSRPTISVQLKRLEEAGLVVRGDDAEDGRRCGFTLTKLGTRTLDQIRSQRNDWLAKRLAALTPQEREQLAGAAAPLLKLASVTP